jgi:hypothetical protein
MPMGCELCTFGILPKQAPQRQTPRGLPYSAGYIAGKKTLSVYGFDIHRIHHSALATVTIATATEINSIVKCPTVQSPD